MDTNFTISNSTVDAILSAIPQLNQACFGDYTSIALGFLLFVSEVLPFIKAQCSDQVADVESKTPQQSKSSIIQDSNGLIDLATKLIKLKKNI